MSKHNYSQYSDKKNKNIESTQEVVETEVIESPEIAVTPAVVDAIPEIDGTVTPAKVETVVGTVANCAKLNVRAKASATADVLCVLDAASEITVNVAKSNKEWVSVCTATGVEGYCMRKFVDVSL